MASGIDSQRFMRLFLAAPCLTRLVGALTLGLTLPEC